MDLNMLYTVFLFVFAGLYRSRSIVRSTALGVA